MSAQPGEMTTIVDSARESKPFTQQSSKGRLNHISPSAAKDYLGCSLRFYFARVLALPAPVSPALHLGKSVHAAIQAYHVARWRGRDSSADVILKHYKEAFEELAQEDEVAFKEGEREKSLLKGEELIRVFLESEHAKSESTPKGVEVMLLEVFPQLSSPLLGYIDLVKEGNIPVDYKTTASTPNIEVEAFQHDLQLTAYQLVIEQATGEKVEARELVFLVKTRTPKIIVHTLPPADEAAITRFWLMMEAAVEGIADKRFYPQPGMHCSWCAFRKQCSQWKGGVA